MKLLVAYPHDMNGSAYHRVCVPARALGAQGVHVTRVNDLMDVPAHRMAQFDAVLVNRVLTTQAVHPAFGDPLTFTNEVEQRIRESGIRVILDLDDTWHLPVSHPQYDYWKKTQHVDAIIAAMNVAHAVWCSTEPLLEQVRQLHGNAHLVMNGINPDHDPQWKHLEKAHSDRMRLGVTITHEHLPDIGRLREALHKLRKRDNWEVVVLDRTNDMRHKISKTLGTSRITMRPWLPVEQYAEHYRHIDLLLCPLAHTPFNTFKSDIKLAECAASRTAVLCEPYGPYRGTRHAVREWYTDLPAIVNDPLALKALVPNAARYGTAESDRVRLETLKRIIGK